MLVKWSNSNDGIQPQSLNSKPFTYLAMNPDGFASSELAWNSKFLSQKSK